MSARPDQLPGLQSNVIDISSGETHNCALLESGTVKCWGLNNATQLGNDPGFGENASAVPVDVIGVVDAQDVVVGGHHSCVAFEF